MEAVRARTKSSCFIPIEVEEFDSINSEVLSSRSDDSIRLRDLKGKLGIIGSTNNKSTIDSGRVVSHAVVDNTEFHTSKLVVGDLEIMPSNIANFFSDSSISSVLPTGQIVEIGSDNWVLPVRVSRVGVVKHNWLARVLSRNHVVEDTQTVSTA